MLHYSLDTVAAMHFRQKRDRRSAATERIPVVAEQAPVLDGNTPKRPGAEL